LRRATDAVTKLIVAANRSVHFGALPEPMSKDDCVAALHRNAEFGAALQEATEAVEACEHDLTAPIDNSSSKRNDDGHAIVELDGKPYPSYHHGVAKVFADCQDRISFSLLILSDDTREKLSNAYSRVMQLKK